jgi:hypothetical protein
MNYYRRCMGSPSRSGPTLYSTRSAYDATQNSPECCRHQRSSEMHPPQHTASKPRRSLRLRRPHRLLTPPPSSDLDPAPTAAPSACSPATESESALPPKNTYAPGERASATNVYACPMAGTCPTTALDAESRQASMRGLLRNRPPPLLPLRRRREPRSTLNECEARLPA